MVEGMNTSKGLTAADQVLLHGPVADEHHPDLLVGKLRQEAAAICMSQSPLVARKVGECGAAGLPSPAER